MLYYPLDTAEYATAFQASDWLYFLKSWDKNIYVSATLTFCKVGNKILSIKVKRKYISMLKGYKELRFDVGSII